MNIPEWRDELIRLGGSIHQDDEAPLSDSDDAVRQAGIERYYEILDDVTEDASPAEIEAILWSLHPIEDYGIYEAAYGALSNTNPSVLGTAAATVLPAWIEKHGDHGSIFSALMFVASRSDARQAFLAGAAAWTLEQRALVLDVLGHWVRADQDWEPIHEALGGVTVSVALDPIPTDWPPTWKTAAEAFRESGRVDLAWPNEKSFPENFSQVLALIELSHGSGWREVPSLLNPLLVRRRDQLPAFVEALAALPEGRRARILAAIRLARPELAQGLETLRGG